MDRDAAGELSASEYLEYRRKLLGMKNPDCLLEVLSEGFCGKCRLLLQQRLRLLIPTIDSSAKPRRYPQHYTAESHNHNSEVSYHGHGDYNTLESCHRHRHHRSREHNGNHSPSEENKKRKRGFSEYSDLILNDGLAGVSSNCDDDLSEEEKETLRFQGVRKQEFVHLEKIDGKLNNVVKGLELHTGVFNEEEQNNIVDYVYHLQRKGRKGQLRKRTYSEPRKWMRGKGRVTIQFGCCYNYATDKNGTPPGIVRNEEVDPLPSLFKKMIKRMVKWLILPSTCVPDSCIVNIYDEGDCIPPHIDHHDFLRPFCTVSFLTESNIIFGTKLEILSPGEFSGPVSIPLPKGSVLILSGNGADLAKHCVPSVKAKRISITFRKMDDRKLPFRFLPDPELQGIKPLDLSEWQEEEKNDELEEGEIKQSDHHHDYSPKPLESLPQWQEEEKKNFQVKKQRRHHNYDSVDFSQLQKEEKNERRQRDHHQYYYSPNPSSQQIKRQRFQVGVY